MKFETHKKPTMKTKILFLLSLLFAPLAPAAEESASAPASGLYADTFLTARTGDFSEATYGYGVGVGYQFTKHWSVEARASHEDLDFNDVAVQDLSARLVARLPLGAVSPYTYIGAGHGLQEPNRAWHIDSGLGIEWQMPFLKALSVFGEGGLRADLEGSNDFAFAAGVRWRF